jgi:hypothetical protein
MAFEKLGFRKKCFRGLWVAALAFLFAGGAIAAQPVANALSRDIDALRSVRYASYTHKPISDTAVGLVNASEDRLSIIYRTYDMTGKQLSSVTVAVSAWPANSAYSNADFLPEKNGRVHLFWLSDNRPCGAIIDSKGKVTSAPTRILEERLTDFDAAAIQEKRGTILLVADRYTSPAADGAPCTKMIFLDMKHNCTGAADYWDLYIDTTRSIVLDEDLGVHVVESTQLGRSKRGEAAIVYRYFGGPHVGDNQQDIAVGLRPDFKDVGLTLDANGIAHIYYTQLGKPAAGSKKANWEMKSAEVKAYNKAKSERTPVYVSGTLIDVSGHKCNVAGRALAK